MSGYEFSTMLGVLENNGQTRTRVAAMVKTNNKTKIGVVNQQQEVKCFE